MAGRAQGIERGREAGKPSDIPKAGWLDIAKRVWANISRFEVSVVSAGVAFNEFFALFPALAAGVSLYGLVADPATVNRQLGILAGFMPADVHSLVAGQLEGLTQASEGTLGLSLLIAVVIALWGATRGVKGMISGLNIVYQEPEQRGFLKYNLTALALTLGAIIFGLMALALVAAVPALLKFLPVGEPIQSLLSFLRWPLLAVFVLMGLAVVYRYAPSRDKPQWRWVSWGAVAAAALWLIGSGLFSLYAAKFGDFNKTYGSMAAVAVTLLWFQLTSFVVLLGGLINAEMEHQTAKDTTEGPSRPMGQRGANMADTLGVSGEKVRGQRGR
ncbi:MAG: YihY/virulence factor BrkB family protein [Rhodospirillaceae bacterium]|nr:YihY/virulence factor BrkB family protein [Rhodospirillales bacterium]